MFVFVQSIWTCSYPIDFHFQKDFFFLTLHISLRGLPFGHLPSLIKIIILTKILTINISNCFILWWHIIMLSNYSFLFMHEFLPLSFLLLFMNSKIFHYFHRWKIVLNPATQLWPAFENTTQACSTASSILASGKMMLADFPPNSRVMGLRLCLWEFLITK